MKKGAIIVNNKFHSEEERQRHLNYQAQLNNHYKGSIVATNKVRYLNNRAVLIHKCIICNHTFWARPSNLLNKPFDHICYKNSTSMTKRKREQMKAKRVKELQKQGILFEVEDGGLTVNL